MGRMCEKKYLQREPKEPTMTTAEQAALAATTLRQRLVDRPSVRLVDIAADLDTSHYVRVWVSKKTPELVEAVPDDVDGVAVRIALT
jgi:hypothetical protein